MVPSQVVVSSGLKAPFKGPLGQLGGGGLNPPKSSNFRACEMQWDFQVCENKLYLLGEALRESPVKPSVLPSHPPAVTWEGT